MFSSSYRRCYCCCRWCWWTLLIHIQLYRKCDKTTTAKRERIAQSNELFTLNGNRLFLTSISTRQLVKFKSSRGQAKQLHAIHNGGEKSGEWRTAATPTPTTKTNYWICIYVQCTLNIHTRNIYIYMYVCIWMFSDR